MLILFEIFLIKNILNLLFSIIYIYIYIYKIICGNLETPPNGAPEYIDTEIFCFNGQTKIEFETIFTTLLWSTKGHTP